MALGLLIITMINLKKNGLMKRLINAELKNTSVTAVLIGSDTYSRPWVRYELFKSFKEGNKLLGIHINSIKGRDSKIKSLGPNPFEYLAIQYSEDGKKLFLNEYKSGKWVRYSDLDGWNISGVTQDFWGKVYKLSKYYNIYDWSADNGYVNFKMDRLVHVIYYLLRIHHIGYVRCHLCRSAYPGTFEERQVHTNRDREHHAPFKVLRGTFIKLQLQAYIFY